ncbi:MAG: hypothetical protein ACD_2C00001G0012 [uncultured bacterium (gcode 4)]|uniref:Pyridoxamine 5'-phosphate oxidase putative domain-containing protein n=1 Tax=uncultured bacterium (gcode 4) TaxID=1234023 RepID=K2G7J1_9BACT|nr:MAG: hypothetical protein ACD_2C00001G0012 [uncultured bacterium (gcode 4)]
MENWKNNFKKDSELILSTSSSSGEPHSIIAISLWFVGGMLLLSDCQMKTTIGNLLDNPRISIIWWYFRIKWEVRITSSGEYFEICKAENEGSQYVPKHAICVRISEVCNLDDGELLQL